MHLMGSQRASEQSTLNTSSRYLNELQNRLHQKALSCKKHLLNTLSLNIVRNHTRAFTSSNRRDFS